MATKLTPLHDRVIVRRFDAETTTKTGIVLPDSAAEKPTRGKIIAAGPGATNDAGHLVPLTVGKGDTVVFGKWSGTELEVDGEKLVILKESDLLGVLD